MNGWENGADALLIVIRAIHFSATAIVAGVLLFRTVVAEPALGLVQPLAYFFDRQTVRIAGISLAVSIASGLAWITAQVPAMSGLSLTEAMTADVIGTVVTQTQFGMVSDIRLALAIILAACLTYDRVPPVRWLGVASALGLVASIALTGHAGSIPGEKGIFHLTVDVLHLVAAAAWIGGLVSLPLLLAAGRRDQASEPPFLAWDVVQRFSTLGIASVCTLLVSGIANTAILVGSLHALLVTHYGRLLMLKMVLFAVMITLAAINRFWLTPRLAGLPSGRTGDAVRRLTRNCIGEILLGLAIFAIVGALGTIHPAIHLE